MREVLEVRDFILNGGSDLRAPMRLQDQVADQLVKTNLDDEEVQAALTQLLADGGPTGVSVSCVFYVMSVCVAFKCVLCLPNSSMRCFTDANAHNSCLQHNHWTMSDTGSDETSSSAETKDGDEVKGLNRAFSSTLDVKRPQTGAAGNQYVCLFSSFVALLPCVGMRVQGIRIGLV